MLNKKSKLILVSLLLIIFSLPLFYLSNNNNKIFAQTDFNQYEYLKLSDYGKKSEALRPRTEYGGTTSISPNNKMLRFNIVVDKIIPAGTNLLQLHTAAPDSSWWQGFMCWMSFSETGNIILKFYVYVDELNEQKIGEYVTDIKIGEQFEVGALLSYDDSTGDYIYKFYLDQQIVFEKSNEDLTYALNTIPHGKKMLIYVYDLYVQVWDMSETIPESDSAWTNSTATALSSKSRYNDALQNDRLNVYDIEDLSADSGYISFGIGAKKQTDGNVRLDSIDERTPLIAFSAKDGNTFNTDIGVKFKSINESLAKSESKEVFDESWKKNMWLDTTIEMGLEINASEAGYYWSASSSNLIAFVWNPVDNKYSVEFFPNGTQGGGSVGMPLNIPSSYATHEDFLPKNKEFTVEYGCFYSQYDDEKTASLINYFILTNYNGDEIYASAKYEGSFIYDHAKEGGKVKISAMSYIRSVPVKIMSVNENLGFLDNYSPEYTESSRIKTNDISAYLPIGQQGVKYSTSSDTHYKSIINVEKFSNNSITDMYLEFSGEYNLRLAFFTDRDNGINATSGYHVVFQPGYIAVQSYSSGNVLSEVVKAYNFQSGQKTRVTIKTAQLYINNIAEGERIIVSINGQEVVSGDFAGQYTTAYPTYFDGIMSGNGSVTFYPYDSTVSADNGIELVSKNKNIDINGRVVLSSEIKKEIIGDVIKYKITSGSEFSELTYNEKSGVYYLNGVKDGLVKVVAYVINEFGEFTSEEMEFVIGTGKAPLELTSLVIYILGALTIIALGSFTTINLIKRKNTRRAKND